ncbi:MAG: trimethylamine methyltransferase family protein [Pseudomonadota bacterium]
MTDLPVTEKPPTRKPPSDRRERSSTDAATDDATDVTGAETDVAAGDEAPRRRRTGGRGAGRVGGRAGNHRRGATLPQELPWGPPRLVDPPIDPMTPEDVAAMDGATMRILEEIGIDFLHPRAQRILSDLGCKVDGPRVRMGRDIVRHHIALAPETFTITPRNPVRALPIGGRHMVFGNVSSPPNCSDIDNGRRPGTREDFRNFAKLSQHFNCIHFLGGYPVEPMDVHPSVRHLHCLHDKLTLSDKVMHAYSLGAERVEDVMEMVRLAGGLTDAEFEAAPRMYTNINSTSPLKHDHPMLDGAMRLADRGQPTVITPFTLAGATAPVTIAGAVAQSLAECLACVVLLQAIRPGVPCAFGTFTNNVDMRSGAPAFGTPEYVQATRMSAQMSRFYGLPIRATNACAANDPDQQAMWESMNSLWACVTSGVNMVYHAAGWLEGGLCASFEKFVMDCEVLNQIIAMQRPVDCSPEALAVEVIAEVDAMPESSRHFFAPSHTQERYETAFYQPFLSDWRNYGTYELDGSIDALHRANRMMKTVLAEFEPPPMPDDHRAALDDFVARRVAEGGAPTDF